MVFSLLPHIYFSILGYSFTIYSSISCFFLSLTSLTTYLAFFHFLLISSLISYSSPLPLFSVILFRLSPFLFIYLPHIFLSLHLFPLLLPSTSPTFAFPFSPFLSFLGHHWNQCTRDPLVLEKAPQPFMLPAFLPITIPSPSSCLFFPSSS